MNPDSLFLRLKSSRLVRHILQVYSFDIVSRVISVGTVLLLIRGLSVEDYAAYTAFFAVLFMAPNLVGSGVNQALVRYSVEYRSRTGAQSTEFYWMSLVFQLVCYGVLCGLVLFFHDSVVQVLFGSKDYGTALYLGLAGGLGLLLIQVVRSVFQAEEKFKEFSWTLLARQSLSFIAVLGILLLNRLEFQTAAQAKVLVDLLIGGSLAVPIILRFRFKKVTRFLKANPGILGEFFSSTFLLIGYFFMLTAFQRLDVFMLSHLSTTAEIAQYGVAFRYYSLGVMLLGSIHVVLLPKFSKEEMQNPTKQRQFTTVWLKISAWIIVPLLVFDLFGKGLFVWVNGSQYERAFYVFIILSVGIALSMMFSPLVNILMSRKAFGFLFLLAVLAFTCNFVGNYVLIPLWGSMGAALVTIFSTALINIFSWIKIFCKKTPLDS